MLDDEDEDKTIHYAAFSLRSGRDIFQKGGHVTDVYKDKRYTMLFDNKRRMSDIVSSHPSLRDSFPLFDINDAKIYRLYSEHGSSSSFDKSLPQKTPKGYKSYLELGIRNFVKALLANELNMTSSSFKSYSEIKTFINLYKPIGVSKKYIISEDAIAQLKRRRNTRVAVPKNTETVGFADYVKTKFPAFDEQGFYGGH